MAKFHLTDNGPKICKASIKNCKYGSHFNNILDANKEYEALLSDKLGMLPNPISKLYILHSPDHAEEDDYDNNTIEHGSMVDEITAGALVFPRNRAIPFGDALEEEVNRHGGKLINTYEQHKFISDSTQWRGLLRHGIKYWTEDDLDNLSDEDGPFFVKGETNALKNEWNKYCYAKNKMDLITVVNNNKSHPLLQNQKIIIQPFLNFKRLGVNSNNGQPVINEWRYFCLNNKIMDKGFYWSQQEVNDNPQSDGADAIVLDTLEDIKGAANFVAVDVAQLEDGSWKVIELNDGNMSGLCGIDADSLWGNIVREIS